MFPEPKYVTFFKRLTHVEPIAPLRHVLGFKMTTGTCTALWLDGMHREIKTWMTANQGESWLVVRQGQAGTSTLEEHDETLKVVSRGRTIGTYHGHNISDSFVCADGSVHRYIGVLHDMRQLPCLAVGMRVMSPGLLYQQDRDGCPF